MKNETEKQTRQESKKYLDKFTRLHASGGKLNEIRCN